MVIWLWWRKRLVKGAFYVLVSFFLLFTPIVHFSLISLMQCLDILPLSFYCFPSLISIFFCFSCWNFEITIGVHFKVSCHTFVVNLDSRWNISINFVVSWQEVNHEDDNCDDDGRHEANLEGNMLLWKWRYEYVCHSIICVYFFAETR